EKRGRVNSGVGYAISINQIKNFMGHLRAGLDADHASLGAVFQIGTGDEEEGSTGLYVSNILDSKECDARRRGLDAGDEMLSFAGRDVANTHPNYIQNIMGLFPRGWRVPMAYRQKDTKKEVLVRLMGYQRQD